MLNQEETSELYKFVIVVGSMLFVINILAWVYFTQEQPLKFCKNWGGVAVVENENIRCLNLSSVGYCLAGDKLYKSPISNFKFNLSGVGQ